MEHKAFTAESQCVRSSAVRFASPKDSLMVFSSLFRVLHQVVTRLPTRLSLGVPVQCLPCDLARAATKNETDPFPVSDSVPYGPPMFLLCHRYSLAILSDNLLRGICLRHMLMTTCSLCSSPLVSPPSLRAKRQHRLYVGVEQSQLEWWMLVLLQIGLRDMNATYVWWSWP